MEMGLGIGGMHPPAGIIELKYGKFTVSLSRFLLLQMCKVFDR